MSIAIANGILATSGESTTADIRLIPANGTNQTGVVSSGRLEVFHNQSWGTVCSRNFGESDAVMACRQLGFEPSTINAGFRPVSQTQVK